MKKKTLYNKHNFFFNCCFYSISSFIKDSRADDDESVHTHQTQFFFFLLSFTCTPRASSQ